MLSVFFANLGKTLFFMSPKSLVITEITITQLSVKFAKLYYYKSEYEYGLDHVGGIRCCESNESPEQTVYENELPRKQVHVLTLQAHYIIISFENVNCCH